jgi:plastocyanin
MLRSALRLAAAGAVAVSAIAVADTAGAVPATVNVHDFVFDPSTSAVKVGEAVTWDFVAPISFGHTTTDSTGLNLWSSPVKSSGSFSFTFTGAGSFAYHCEIHPFMTGQVRVKPSVSPAKGTAATTFTLTFATAAPPSGDVFDVQVATPATGGSFVTLKRNLTTTSLTYHATDGPGTYQFRARMRSSASGVKSAYSPKATITVS